MGQAQVVRGAGRQAGWEQKGKHPCSVFLCPLVHKQGAAGLGWRLTSQAAAFHCPEPSVLSLRPVPTFPASCPSVGLKSWKKAVSVSSQRSPPKVSTLLWAPPCLMQGVTAGEEAPLSSMCSQAWSKFALLAHRPVSPGLLPGFPSLRGSPDRVGFLLEISALLLSFSSHCVCPLFASLLSPFPPATHAHEQVCSHTLGLCSQMKRASHIPFGLPRGDVGFPLCVCPHPFVFFPNLNLIPG